MIVVTAFSDMNYEAQGFNNDLNGLKTAIYNGQIKWLALSGNITNMALSSTVLFKNISF